MSIVSAKLEPNTQQGTRTEGGKRTYRAMYVVVTDDINDGPLTVRMAAGIPQIGDSYSLGNDYDPTAFVKSITPTRKGENSKVWEVVVEWSELAKVDNPLNRPAKKNWGFEQAGKVAWQDIDGKAILNSAGDYFDPPIEIEDSRPLLTVVRNDATFDPLLAIDYQDAVNEDRFLIANPGQCKVAGIEASEEEENDVKFWRVVFHFAFRREGWLAEPLDQGRYATVDANGAAQKRTPIPDKAGDPVTDPVPLDGKGAELVDATPETAKFLKFTVYKKRLFSRFNIR